MDLLISAINLSLKLEMKDSSPQSVFQIIQRFFKVVFDFKFESDYSQYLENAQQFFIPGKKRKEQFFTSEVHEGLKEWVSLYMLSYLKSIETVEEKEYQFMKPLLFNLISMSCKLAQSEIVNLKVVGIQMLSQVISMFRYSVEKIGDEDSDDERKGSVAKGPLLLEIYEAQIHSVIRVGLQDVFVSFVFSKDLLFLTEQFLQWGICKDESVKQKTIEQLMAIMIPKEQ